MDIIEKKDIGFLFDKRYTYQSRNIMLMGFVSDCIFDKNLFKTNMSLTPFLKIYAIQFNITDEENEHGFKKYLMASRPAIVSRILSHMSKMRSAEEINDLTKKSIDFIAELQNELSVNNGKQNKKEKTSLFDDLKRINSHE